MATNPIPTLSPPPAGNDISSIGSWLVGAYTWLLSLQGILGLTFPMTSDNVYYTNSGIGATKRSLTAKLGDVVDGRDFNLVPDTGGNMTAAFNNAIIYCITNTKSLWLERGTYNFSSKPIDITGFVCIYGNGAVLNKNYIESSPTNPFIQITGAGRVIFKNMQITNTQPGGILVAALSTATISPDFSIFEDVVFHGGGFSKYAFYGDGTPRSSSGLRDFRLINIVVFACTDALMYLKQCNNFLITGSLFPAGGITNKLVITGDSTHTSNNINLTLNYCEAVDLDWTNDIVLNISTLAIITNTSHVNRVICNCQGAIQSNWTNATIQTTGATRVEGTSTVKGDYSVGSGGALTRIGATTGTRGFVGTENLVPLYLRSNAIDAGYVGTTQGLVWGSPTGLDKGAGSINATTLYLNGTAITSSSTLTVPITLPNGGTGAALTASNGGIVYSTASALALLAGTATAGQILRSGSNAAPTWSTATYPATAGTSGNFLKSDGTNWASSSVSFAASGANSDIASLTGISGVIQAPTQINDVNGNEVIKFTSTTSAVNEITFTNASTTNGPVIAVTGGDTNTVLNISAKGSGSLQLQASNFIISSGGAVTTGSWTATTIGVIYGGTGLTGCAQGDLFYGSATNTITALAKNTTATRYLSNQGTSNSPSWNQVNLANGVTGLLPIANGGTGVASLPTAAGYLSSGITMTASAYTIITIDTKEFDVGSYLDVSTNKGRYTPLLAGVYRISWAIDISNPQLTTLYGSALHLNNVTFKAGSFGEATVSTAYFTVGCALVKMNGSTDFIDVRVFNGHLTLTATAAAGQVNTWIGVEYIGPSV